MTTDPLWANPFLSSIMKDSNLLAGFININNIESSNPELEEKIVKEIAGYGRQLGRIMDVMKIILAKGALTNLDDSEEKAVAALKELIENIEKKKLQANLAAITPQNVDEAIEVLSMLDENHRRKVVGALQATLSGRSGS